MAPDDMICTMFQARYAVKLTPSDAVYYGTQAVLLNLFRIGNVWPPTTPAEFAAGLGNAESEIVTLAKGIIEGEATSPLLQGLK